MAERHRPLGFRRKGAARSRFLRRKGRRPTGRDLEVERHMRQAEEDRERRLALERTRAI